MSEQKERYRVAVITNCTASSSMSPAPLLEGATLPREASLGATLAEWCKRIEDTKEQEGDKYKASPFELYRGIGFHTIMNVLDGLAAKDIEVEMYIISLGFGLVKATDPIQSYNINTWGTDPSSLQEIVTGEPFKPRRWWEGINRILNKTDSPVADLIDRKEHDLVLIATTSKFLELYASDLAKAVQYRGETNIRVVGPSLGKGYVAKDLKLLSNSDIIMPYDRRLGRKIVGNRNDFAHRCALHFVTDVLPNDLEGSVTTHKKTVQDAMNAMGDPIVRDRTEEISSEDLTAFLKQEGEGKSSDEVFKLLISRGVKVSHARILLLMEGKESISTDEQEAASSAWDQIEPTAVSGDMRLQEVLEALIVFQSTAKEHTTQRVFIAKDIKIWAERYFEGLGKTLPDMFASTNKLSRLLNRSGKEIGIVKVITSSQYGVAKYELVEKV